MLIMLTGLDDLLARASLRIDLDGKPNGTGFLVAPTVIVTCAHVVQPALSGSNAASGIVVVDSSGGVTDVRGAPHLDEARDLAILRLATALVAPPPAVLFGDVQRADELVAYGYPEDYPFGATATFEVEGRVGGPTPYIKVKNGQAVPGMSGSALLNVRTGAVCAVLKRTRDRRQDLGGYGIPISSLRSSPAFADVVPAVRKAHQALSPWRDAMSPTQRRALASDQNEAGLDRDPHEFVVGIQQAESEWTVRSATTTDRGAEVRVDLNAVRMEMTRLFRAWRSHERIDDKEQARLIGQVMYRSVFPDPIGSELERMLLAGDGARVDIGLHFDCADTELVYLPWEQLYVPDRPHRAGLALASLPGVTLTRVLRPEPEPPRVPSSSRLRVALVSAPLPPGVDVRRGTGTRVDQVAEDVARCLCELATVEVEDLGVIGSEELAERLEQHDDYDVLHYVGYGRYRGREDHLALRDDDDEEDVQWLSPEALGEILGVDPPAVVVLHTCDGLPTETPGDLTELAPRLLLGGVRGVVACQSPLPDREQSVKLVREFYTVVAAGGSVRRAVQQARSKLRKRNPWTQPAVFLRTPGDLFLVRPAGRPEWE